MRLNIKHIAIATIFLFAQIFASAAISDHLGDPLHTGDDCTICTSISAGTDDGLPPPAAEYPAPLVTLERVTPLMSTHVATRTEKSQRARAPPTPA